MNLLIFYFVHVAINFGKIPLGVLLFFALLGFILRRQFDRYPKPFLFLSLLLFAHFLLSQKTHSWILILTPLDAFLGWILLSQSYDPQNTKTFLKDLLQNSIRMTLVMSLFALGAFAVFPRTPAEWFGGGSSEGVVGFGSGLEIFPGQTRKLNESSKVAFIVKMEHPIPDTDLYWRGPTLTSTLDGLHWFHPMKIRSLSSSPQNPLQQKFFLYEHNSDSPIALDAPHQVQVITENLVEASSDRAIGAGYLPPPTPIESRKLFISDKSLKAKLDQLARGERSELKIRDEVLKWYAQDFQYTLTPGVLPEPRLSSFLLKAKKGYCEHFAASFSSIMRYFGFPSRVVLGYRGGTWNPYSKSYRVDQDEAHAWSEFWSPTEQRWIRVDPTRVIHHFSFSKAESSRSKLSYLLEAAFSEARFFFEENPGAALAASLALIFLVLGSIYKLLKKPRSPEEELIQLYQDFCKKMKNHGVSKSPHQGPLDFRTAVLKRYPQTQSELSEFTEHYIVLRYSKQNIEMQEVLKLRSLMKKLFARVSSNQGPEASLT